MAPHSLPQPSVTLSSPTGPLQPLKHPAAPYGLLQLSEADAKKEIAGDQTRATKPNSLIVRDANHYTTAPDHFESV
jgi:hypothetical protein